MTLYDYAVRNGRPELLAEWDTAGNNGLTPKTAAPSGRERAAWICPEGHRYRAMIESRTRMKTGCPYCAGQKTLPGVNDIVTLRPELLSLWNTERNGELSPKELMPGSHRKVWWRCEKGHEWEAAVYNVSSGGGCPYCAGYWPIPGETDLASTHPALAAEWDFRKNKLLPSEVSRGTNKKVWWLCPEGHTYSAFVYARIAGDGCPYCSGKKVLPGFNDLATTDPALAAEWADDSASPASVNRGSHKRVKWRCALGHEYEAEIYARAAGNGCPYCSGHKVLVGFNDLATTHPRIAAQWDEELNGSLTPQMVTRGSNKRAWFRCEDGHVWSALIFSRTRAKGTGCPVCAGQVKTKLAGRYRRDTIRRRAPAERRETAVI